MLQHIPYSQNDYWPLVQGRVYAGFHLHSANHNNFSDGIHNHHNSNSNHYNSNGYYHYPKLHAV